MENKTNYSAIISSRAQKEMIKSFDWYEQQKNGLGDRFINDVLDRISSIEQNPELYTSTFKSYRETSITMFPFIIVYRIFKRKKIIQIVSVFHTSQNPRKKY